VELTLRRSLEEAVSYVSAMTTSLLTTKLYIPPPHPGLVKRPRLIERLDEGLRLGRKLTLVSAPAGFGETTLIGEWACGSAREIAWLSLDKGGNDSVF
jgi:LuxR family maltose regulon positive regulatory protein